MNSSKAKKRINAWMKSFLVFKLNVTLSGESAVGLQKEFVDRELDLNSLDLIHNIKPQFEPNGIFNPD